MFEIKGKYNSATVFAKEAEETAFAQILDICNQEFLKDSKIRMMPDLHAGKGCTVGTTMTVTDKIVPNFVGVDLGCGMICVKLAVSAEDVDFEKLDKVIQEHVPSGMSARSKEHVNIRQIPFDKIKAPYNQDRAKKSVGTLGGGNHFIEVNTDDEGFLYLVIHSGSRNLGKNVAEHYQKVAIENLTKNKTVIEEAIAKLKAEGRHSEIANKIQELKKNSPKIAKEMAYVEGEDMKNYLHDVAIAQQYAKWNRQTMADVIMKEMGWLPIEQFDTIHNYVDLENMILRKGAISAQKGEVVIIPMNMRDGSIIAVGKGNDDWNCSGPHGAGRLMSRSKAKELVKLEDFQETMKDVWTTSVVQSTLDESPFAYKPMEDIIEAIQDTVEIQKIIKPLYNFKAK